MHKQVLVALVCVACATVSTPVITESDHDVLITLSDVRRLGFEPDGRIEESYYRENPTPTTASLEYDAIGRTRGGGPLTLILYSNAWILEDEAAADRALDEISDNQFDMIKEIFNPTVELRNDVFSGGDESSFWIMKKNGLSIAHIFRLRQGNRAFFLFLVGYSVDDVGFWQPLLGPHVSALDNLVITPETTSQSAD